MLNLTYPAHKIMSSQSIPIIDSDTNHVALQTTPLNSLKLFKTRYLHIFMETLPHEY